MKILWPMIALCLVAGCERQSPTIMLPSDYKTVFSTDYADVTIYLDTAYIAPGFDELPSEKDFDAAHDVIMRHLNTVGRATEETSGGDFYLNRYFEPRGSINVVSDFHSAEVITALIAAQKELKGEFAINLDSHPAYVSVVPDGRVIGYTDTDDDEDRDEGLKILRDYGLPTEKTGEQAAP
jgi:hypothetical protein